MIKPKVNDILSYRIDRSAQCWGFYQVIKVTNKTITIREIDNSFKPYNNKDPQAGGKIIPIIDSCTGEPIRRLVKHFNNGKYYVRVDSASYAVLWDNEPGEVWSD